MPRKKYDSRRVNIVGDFFEDMAEAMFTGIERAPYNEGDFCLWHIGSGIEVKASDSNHEIRIPLQQIENYQKISCGFPLEAFFFLLFLYDNPYVRTEDGQRITSMSRLNEILDIRGFIASSSMTLFMVEASLLPYMFSVGRISDKSIPLHRGVESLNLRPKHLKVMTNGGLELVAGNDSGLRAEKFQAEISFSRYVLEEKYRISTEIRAVGRPKNIRRLVGAFNPKAVSFKRV